jgi:hypothetical protein
VSHRLAAVDLEIAALHSSRRSSKPPSRLG